MSTERLLLKVKVVPGSSRDSIGEWLGDSLKIKLRAPPEKGKANQALIRLLAERLGLPEQEIRIIRGQSSPNKVLELPGHTPMDTLERRRDGAR